MNQINYAFLAAGYSRTEVEGLTQVLRDRIEELSKL